MFKSQRRDAPLAGSLDDLRDADLLRPALHHAFERKLETLHAAGDMAHYRWLRALQHDLLSEEVHIDADREIREYAELRVTSTAATRRRRVNTEYAGRASDAELAEWCAPNHLPPAPCLPHNRLPLQAPP